MGWEIAAKIEHEVARIITQQEVNGWKFDIPKAHQHLSLLDNECQRLYDSIREHLGHDRYMGTGTVLKPFKKDGTLSERVKKYWGRYSENTWGPYTPLWYEEPDLGKRQRLIKHLERLGWRPTEWTYKGNPKITEESMTSLKGDLGKNIAKWWILSHRRSQIAGWLDLVRSDGRIAARATPCGTPTARMRHQVIVNVPKTNHAKTGELLYYPEGKVVFGTEMRELFIAEEGYILIGYDAKGLEIRILAHYLDDPEFYEVATSGDVHAYFQEKIGIPDRDQSKTFEYAFFYGAEDPKLGSILGGTRKDGREARERFLRSVPSLGRLLQGVKGAAAKGYLTGIDGRKLFVRKESASLNTLIQGGGAISMKVIMLYLDKLNRNSGLDLSLCKKVGDFHDEGQHEVWNEEKYIELFKKNVVKAISQTNKFLKLRCPLEGEMKIGPNWSYTH